MAADTLASAALTLPNWLTRRMLSSVLAHRQDHLRLLVLPPHWIPFFCTHPTAGPRKSDRHLRRAANTHVSTNCVIVSIKCLKTVLSRTTAHWTIRRFFKNNLPPNQRKADEHRYVNVLLAFAWAGSRGSHNAAHLYDDLHGRRPFV